MPAQAWLTRQLRAGLPAKKFLPDEDRRCQTPQRGSVLGGDEEAVEVEAGLGVFLGIAADGGVSEVGDRLAADEIVDGGERFWILEMTVYAAAFAELVLHELRGGFFTVDVLRQQLVKKPGMPPSLPIQPRRT